MMDENAEDNSRSTTDTKRCHHRMPFHHCSVDGVNKDNNSFNHRYTIVTVCHSPPFTQQYIPYSSSNIIIGKKECFLQTHIVNQQTVTSSLYNTIFSCHELTLERNFQPAHTHRFNCTLHYKSMKHSLKPERNLIENKCDPHTIIPRIIKK